MEYYHPDHLHQKSCSEHIFNSFVMFLSRFYPMVNVIVLPHHLKFVFFNWFQQIATTDAKTKSVSVVMFVILKIFCSIGWIKEVTCGGKNQSQSFDWCFFCVQNLAAWNKEMYNIYNIVTNGEIYIRYKKKFEFTGESLHSKK